MHVPTLQTSVAPQVDPLDLVVHDVLEDAGWQMRQGFVGSSAPAGYEVFEMKHPSLHWPDVQIPVGEHEVPFATTV